jgi:hypothetical protein
MLMIVPAKNVLMMWFEEQAEITYTARHVWVLATSKLRSTWPTWEKDYIEKQSRRGERIAVISRFSSGAKGNLKALILKTRARPFSFSEVLAKNLIKGGATTYIPKYHALIETLT